MVLLALDTCDSRGSLAILRDDDVLHVAPHDPALDYSSWLLPAADVALTATGLQMRDLQLFAVAAGPGSFTGIRVGLTTLKAWSEVYGTKIAAISRLEALAAQANRPSDHVAAFIDAHRQQVFGALYLRENKDLRVVDEEMVIAPEGFVEFVEQRAEASRIHWISLDPQKITTLSMWTRHATRGEQVQLGDSVLAPVIGRIGRRRAAEGRLQDALSLDAEYVRRSDAEIFWKGGAKRGA